MTLRKLRTLLIAVFLVTCLTEKFTVAQDTVQDDPKTAELDDAPTSPARKFKFHYGATLTDVPANVRVQVWFPIANSNSQQEIELLETRNPASLQLNRESKYGNEIGYFETESTSEPISFSLSYRVARQAAKTDTAELELSEADKIKFTAANKLVPITGAPLRLLDGKKFSDSDFENGQQLYEIVEEHMKYDKSLPGYGNGDTLWACDSQTGNCTDFHSLFISLARSKKIPSKFEIGFPIGESPTGDVKGYHCWAWFHSKGKGWVPVDISEADKHPELKDFYFGQLTADRVAFSVGRDIELVPAAASGAKNFFVYPHVEVDGKLWPKDKINLQFRYEEIQSDP